MAKSKITIGALKKAQEKGKKILDKLEKEGYEISRYTIDMVNKPISHKTQKEARVYLSRMTERYIKSRAVNINKKRGGFVGKVKIDPLYLKQNPIVDSAYKSHADEIMARDYTYSVGKSNEKFANDIYNMIVTAAKTYSRSVDVRASINAILVTLKLERGEFTTFYDDVKNQEQEIKKGLMNIKDKEKFLKSPLFNRFLNEGVFSPEMVAARRELSLMSSKQTFRNRPGLNLTPERVTTIYDFFAESSIWQLVRDKYHPSEEQTFDMFIDKIENYLSKGELTVKDIDNALGNYASHKSLTKVLDDAIGYAALRH